MGSFKNSWNILKDTNEDIPMPSEYFSFKKLSLQSMVKNNYTSSNNRVSISLNPNEDSRLLKNDLSLNGFCELNPEE